MLEIIHLDVKQVQTGLCHSILHVKVRANAKHDQTSRFNSQQVRKESLSTLLVTSVDSLLIRYLKTVM